MSRHIAIALVLSPAFAFASQPDASTLEQGFVETVHPFVQTYCISCHSGDKPKAQFDMSPYSSVESVSRDHAHWDLVLERLLSAEMPPEKAKAQPTAQARQAVIDWIETWRRAEAAKTAGDPGVVLARRLSNAEYNYTIRDLTGVDIRPTREFPVDPANPSGFDNSGESLAMSPALVKKYLQAAQEVASHMVLKQDGFDFAPHPMLVETDRDKYCIKRIVDFYQRQPTDYASYFMAAWRYRHRAALGKPKATLAEIATEARVSPKYLRLIFDTLTDRKEQVGPIARLQTFWNALPAPTNRNAPDVVQTGCAEMRTFVVKLREKLEWKFKNLELKGFSAGGQHFIGWKNRQYASHRMTLNPSALQIEGDPTLDKAAFVTSPADDFGGEKVVTNSVTIPRDSDLTIPADPSQRARHMASFERFCRVFPDAFYVSERGRMHLDRPREKQDKGRLLSAGFHNMMGYFRDDTPLYQLILDEQGQRELDTLWTEFDCVASVPERQHVEFIFYERAEGSRTMKTPEFDFVRSEDKDVTSAPNIERLAQVYLAKARESYRTNGGDTIAVDVIADHFRMASAHIRRTEQARRAAEPKHLEKLQKFAERAYRRPLTSAERKRLLSFYHTSRTDGGLEHEEAMRDCIVTILMSPNFCYRVDLIDEVAKKGQ